MNDDEVVTVKTIHGRYQVHRHWFDPVDVIAARSARKRVIGSWRRIRDEWVFVPYKDEDPE